MPGIMTDHTVFTLSLYGTGKAICCFSSMSIDVVHSISVQNGCERILAACRRNFST